jgi:mevalonate kinase
MTTTYPWLESGREEEKRDRTEDRKKWSDQYFGHGKLLLTGEYFLIDGAQGLALPTKVGQSLYVNYQSSFNPVLNWKSYDVSGNIWFEANYEFWHFDCLDPDPSREALFLQHILRQVRRQNKHFLREKEDVLVETHLGFPLNWGLGSSSALIYNIAQWAYISPFELLFNTYGGSGYDIACAQSEGPILYQKKEGGPHWSPVSFNPDFKENLFFVYLGKKQNSRDAVKFYRERGPFAGQVMDHITSVTQDMLRCQDFEDFNRLIETHEEIVSTHLDLCPVKMSQFQDYWGAIKSLGAWGGDFILVTSDRGEADTRRYFEEKGLSVVLAFDDIILNPAGPQANWDDHGQLH